MYKLQIHVVRQQIDLIPISDFHEHLKTCICTRSHLKYRKLLELNF